MDVTVDRPTCPFCTFSVTSDGGNDMYFLMQHLELYHPENGQSPFIALEESSELRLSIRSGRESMISTDTPSEDNQEDFVECPTSCGETVTYAELPSHMELHAAEDVVLDEEDRGEVTKDPQTVQRSKTLKAGQQTTKLPLETLPDSSKRLDIKSPRRHRHSHGKRRDHYGIKDWKDLLLGSSSKKTRTSDAKPKHAFARRLGRSELGPHAYEEQMPSWLLTQLERGARVTVVNQLTSSGQIARVEQVANETSRILPVIAQLCERDLRLSKIFLCHPDVKHVVKMAREGGFCGYRNIQMMISFIQATKFPGHEHFPGRIPSILRLQDLIEAAWDRGINSTGRIETGGIVGTRKYIGTPEALLISLGIGCEANAFNKVDQTPVHLNLLQSVAEYFATGVTDLSKRVYKTSLPPLYFQHPGHSLTIIGLEVHKSGAMTLLVLDPMFKTSPALCRLIGGKVPPDTPEKLLKAYRRGDSYLSKYNSFEILKLKPSQSLPEGWPH